MGLLDFHSNFNLVFSIHLKHPSFRPSADVLFNSKLGHFAALRGEHVACIQPLLELKTRARFRPVSPSLSTDEQNNFVAQMAGKC
jgi:hypothetical protein